jgi:hypothetical protein
MRAAILLLKAVVSLQANMEEMRVMVVEVKMLVMIWGQPKWSSKNMMNTVFTTCPQNLQIARGANLQGNVQLIRIEIECEILRITEHRMPLKFSPHRVLIF